jgi:predicted ATPase
VLPPKSRERIPFDVTPAAFSDTLAGMRPPAFLNGFHLERDSVPSFDEYPFSIPAIKAMDRVKLHPSVTFFIGENGSGKSTLIEALAVKNRLNPEGGSLNFDFTTRASHSELSEHLVLDKSLRRVKEGYFLRAESFFNVATEIEKLDAIANTEDIRKLGPSYGDRPLHEQSHGESFFALLTNRLYGDGLYIFDEPEAALSPMRQMSMLVLMKGLVDNGAQFIIATHSPILLAYPDALIYQMTADGMEQVPYTETEHYCVTRDFLNRPEKMLGLLFDELPLRTDRVEPD